jgi:response regulator of citrate/malate metabolism
MSGQIGYLVKPVRHEDLCDALSKFSFWNNGEYNHNGL